MHIALRSVAVGACVALLLNACGGTPESSQSPTEGTAATEETLVLTPLPPLDPGLIARLRVDASVPDSSDYGKTPPGGRPPPGQGKIPK